MSQGGYEHGGVSRSVFRFDLGNNQWEQARSMNEVRIRHSSCVLKNKLYVFGGYDDSGLLQSLDVLDVESSTLEVLDVESSLQSSFRWSLINLVAITT